MARIRPPLAFVAVILTLMMTPGSLAQQPASTSEISTGTLAGGQVVPPAATGALGVGTLFLSRSLRTIGYRANVFNLPSGLVAAHLHVGSPGVTGPIVATLNVLQNLSSDFTLSGTVFEDQLQLRPEEGLRSLDDVMQAAASGALYLDIHTASRPNGEIRGQMCPQRDANTSTGVALCEGPPNRLSP